MIQVVAHHVLRHIIAGGSAHVKSSSEIGKEITKEVIAERVKEVFAPEQEEEQCNHYSVNGACPVCGVYCDND